MRFIFGASGNIDSKIITQWLHAVSTTYCCQLKKIQWHSSVIFASNQIQPKNSKILIDGDNVPTDIELNYEKALMGNFCFYKMDGDGIIFSNDFYASTPLYYYQSSETLFFSNNLRVLFCNKTIPFKVNDESCFEFCSPVKIYTESELSQSKTFFERVFKLPPGSILVYKNYKLSVNRKKYKNLIADAPYIQNIQDSCLMLRERLNSIIYNLAKTNKIILSFSGGLDSSVILASLIDVGVSNYDIYSFCFHGEEIDDKKLIQNTFSHLGIEGRIIYADDLLGVNNIDGMGWYIDGPNLIGSDNVYRLIDKNLISNEAVVLTGMGGDELFSGTKYSSDYFLRNKLGGLLRERIKKIAQLESKSFLSRYFLGVVCETMPLLRDKLYKSIFWNDINTFKMNLNFYLPAFTQKNFSKEISLLLEESRFLKTWYRRYIFDNTFPRVASQDVVYQNFHFCSPFRDFSIYQLANMIPPCFHYDINGGALGTYEVSKQILRKSYADILPPYITQKSRKTNYGSMFIKNIKSKKNKILQLFSQTHTYTAEMGIIKKSEFMSRLKKLFILIDDPQYQVSTDMCLIPRIIAMEIWLQWVNMGREKCIMEST